MTRMTTRTKARCSALAAAALIAGCGGGGGGGNDDHPPELRTVAFTRQVGSQFDLYLVQEDGTDERALVTGPGDKFFFGVSHNRLLFMWSRPGADGQSQKDLYSIAPDGSGLIALASSADDEEFEGPTADERVVFTRIVGRNRQRDLYSIKLDGTGQVPLATSGDSEYVEFMTADGRVVFGRDAGGRIDLYSIRADGTGTVLLASGFTPGVRPTADGRIVFARPTAPDRSDLWIVNIDGTGLRQLTNLPGQTRAVAETPSGRLIIDVSSNLNQEDLYSIGLDGTGLAPLAVGPDRQRFGALDADGRVVFTRLRGGREDIHVINEDGTGLRVLADSDDIELPLTAVAGQVFFLRSNGADATSELYRIPMDGSTAAVLLAGGVSRSGLRVSPSDGPRWLFFNVQADAGDVDLYALPLDGSSVPRLLAESRDDERVVRLVEGDRVVVSRSPPGSSQNDLYIVNPDGTGLRALATGPTPERFGGMF